MIKFVGIAQHDKAVLLYFLQTEGDNTFFKVVSSENGFEFSDKSIYVFALDTMQREEQSYNWDSFRASKKEDQYFLSYKSKDKTHLQAAVSNDLAVWQKLGDIDEIKETGATVPDYLLNDKYVMYVGDKDISLAASSDLKNWTTEKKSLLVPRNDYFDKGNITVGNAFIHDGNILLTYYSGSSVGAAIFDIKDPTHLLWRSEEPVWEKPETFGEHLNPLGSAVFKGQLILYFLIGDANIFSVSAPIPNVNTRKQNGYNILIKKHKDNPIIKPRPENPWESRATFNTAALLEDGKVHFLYRALGDTDLSVLGYASSSDGTTIDERLNAPAYIPREPFETPGGNRFNSFAEHFASGGGYGGVEDPRITRVDDRVYLTYVAFDGATPPRAAMSSINIDDFLKHKWDKWEKPKLISAPGMVNKSAVVFPRKVRGKYVVMHRVYPNILIDYLDDLEFNNYLQGQYFIPPRKKFWDSKKVGAGAPPMETKDGWLLIYQSVGHQDSSRYKIGAMMLDKNNPEKVLYRTHMPIIEPNESYENDGFKAGVVYPCGSVIMKDKLHVYYGGADSVVCAASSDLDSFLDEMKRNQEPKLRQITSRAFITN